MSSRSSVALAFSLLSLFALAGCDATPAALEGSAEAATKATSGALPCADVVLCTGSCAAGDAGCAAECARMATPSASMRARDLAGCVERASCGRDQTCAQERCAGQIEACTTDS